MTNQRNRGKGGTLLAERKGREEEGGRVIPSGACLHRQGEREESS